MSRRGANEHGFKLLTTFIELNTWVSSFPNWNLNSMKERLKHHAALPFWDVLHTFDYNARENSPRKRGYHWSEGAAIGFQQTKKKNYALDIEQTGGISFYGSWSVCVPGQLCDPLPVAEIWLCLYGVDNSEQSSRWCVWYDVLGCSNTISPLT